MMHANASNESVPESGGVEAPKVAPTYAPFLLALGITMMFWGIVTSPVMSIGGFVVFVWGLFLWTSAIAQGWRK